MLQSEARDAADQQASEPHEAGLILGLLCGYTMWFSGNIGEVIKGVCNFGETNELK